mgnify:CR=1 FL=1
MQVFPVAGEASFVDSYGEPRSNGRRHEGIDIFAAQGTPVVAVDDGKVTFGASELGGTIAHLRTTEAVYYYAHLASTLGVDRVVRAGEPIGAVGRTGNASGTAPHLHFEERFFSGEPTNPFPELREARTGPTLPPSSPSSPSSPKRPTTAPSGLGLLLLIYLVSRRT